MTVYVNRYFCTCKFKDKNCPNFDSIAPVGSQS